MQTLTLKPRTIKQQLLGMIAKHGLHEVLERLSELVEAEAMRVDSHDLTRTSYHVGFATLAALKAAHHEWLDSEEVGGGLRCKD